MVSHLQSATAMQSMQIAWFACWVAACGGSSSSSDVTTLSGSAAFAVTSSAMVPGGLHCATHGALSNGQFEALTIVAADVDLDATSCTSGNYDTQPHDVRIEIATGNGYYGSGSSHPPIVAGMVFPILNEGVNDEDLCGNVASGTSGPQALAMVSVCTGSSCNTQFAGSGSVAVTAISATTIEGTFDVTLLDQDGNAEGAQGALSGTFVADTCSARSGSGQ
jgi:hypothetical protein